MWPEVSYRRRILQLTLVFIATSGAALGCDGRAVGHSDDTALLDAGRPDVALIDGSLTDGALVDSSIHDSAQPDAALPDAAIPDAAVIPGCSSSLFLTGRVLATTYYEVAEFTLGGVELQRFNMIHAGSSGDYSDELRDLAVDACGAIYAYQGTFSPEVARRDPSGAFAYFDNPEFSTSNVSGYGGLAITEDYVFVTDTGTYGSQDIGVVRFNAADGADGIRFATTMAPIDLNIGLDGLLYVLEVTGDVTIFTPDTLVETAGVTLAEPVRAIAATASGEIYGASWDGPIYHFDAMGLVIASLDPGINSLADIDIDTDGTIAVSSWDSQIAITDLSLSSASSFTVSGNHSFFVPFVTFTHTGTQ